VINQPLTRSLSRRFPDVNFIAATRHPKKNIQSIYRSFISPLHRVWRRLHPNPWSDFLALALDEEETHQRGKFALITITAIIFADRYMNSSLLIENLQ